MGTMPSWFWMLYYSFISATFIATIISLYRRRHKTLSIINFILLLLMPFIVFVYSLGRPEGMTELMYLVRGVLNGSIWAIVSLLGFSYSIFWWIVFLMRRASSPKK